MKKNSRIAAGAAVAGAALIAVSGTVAGTADAGKLPGGFKSKNLGDGNSIQIRLFDESVTRTKAVTNIPTSREVLVSGKIAITTKGDIKGATLTSGYQVGCQVNFGASGEGGAGVTGDTAKGTASGTSEVGGGFKLGPGETAFKPIINVSGDEDDINSISFTKGRGGLAYSQERFGVDGCAGHASARAIVKVQAKTDTFKGNITLYGKPFSLG
ncbi:MspA family porin [Gordonia sp. HY002]|uniref:MspA family porin n=1 Tax=Gordonia zhenghanii TaxID=2911516 RepID=UPI001EF15DC2|nr:MspA family porin [Gordonia zhenghanii]MCF8571273.1 MspA family porin [Gordonia zhenghanii]MCF8601797.1 MspA family porin [Gordonia zhenghanii]